MVREQRTFFDWISQLILSVGRENYNENKAIVDFFLSSSHSFWPTEKMFAVFRVAE